MNLFRRGKKDPEPIIAKMLPSEVPVTVYAIPEEPKQITNSWIVGHSCFFYHGLDWVYLQELWTEQPCVLYVN